MRNNKNTKRGSQGWLCSVVLSVLQHFIAHITRRSSRRLTALQFCYRKITSPSNAAELGVMCFKERRCLVLVRHALKRKREAQYSDSGVGRWCGDGFVEYSFGVREEDRKLQTRCRLKGRKNIVGLEEKADQYNNIWSGVVREVF